jgi:hypothetical protein
MKKKHDPELIKYLLKRSQVKNEESFEVSRSMANWLNSMADKYSMPIDKFINDVTPYESIRQYYANIYQVIRTEFYSNDIDKLILYYNRVKEEFSEPQHPESKTKVIYQYHVEFIQNLINKLEADKKINTNRVAPPEGLKCKDNIKPDDLKFIFTKLEGKFHKSVTASDFVNTFQVGALPDGWQRLRWIGSNPELATLFYLLTGIKPIPSIVTKYFRTDKEYTNTSGGRTNNRFIINLITAALK